MKRILTLLLVSLQMIPSAYGWVWFRFGPERRATLPSLFLNLNHPHPDTVKAEFVLVMETPIFLYGYDRNKDTGFIQSVVFRTPRGESRTRDFKQTPTISFHMNSGPTTATLLGQDGSPNYEEPMFLEVSNKEYGRIRFEANINDVNGFGRWVEWEKRDGQILTPKKNGHERLLNENGFLRQFKTPEYLFTIQELKEGGMEWNLYNIQDVKGEKDSDGFYQPKPSALPKDTTRLVFPFGQPYHRFFYITREQGKTDGVTEYHLRKSKARPNHIVGAEYPPERFHEVDPEGTSSAGEEKPPRLWWQEKDVNTQEIGARYMNATGMDYFDELWRRAGNGEEEKAWLIYTYSDETEKGSYGKDRMRVFDPSYEHWQIRFYDPAGRLRAEYRPPTGTPGPPPSLEEEVLKQVADGIEIDYGADKNQTTATQITHWISGKFVSRTWIREGKDPSGTDALLLERTEDPDRKAGHAEHAKETRPFLWPGILF